MSLKINNSFLYQAIIIIFYLLLVFRMYIGTHSGLFGQILTLGFVLLGIFLTINFKIKGNSLTLWFIILMLLFGIITAIFGKNYKVSDIFFILTYFGIALIPVYVKLNYKLFLWFAYSIVIFFSIFYFKGIHPGTIFFSSSENGVSELLLITLGYHLVSCFQNEKPPSIILIILSFSLAVWAIGRGGIIAVGLILISYPFMTNLKKKYKYLILLFIIVLPIVIYSAYPKVFEVVFERFNWYASRGYSIIESPRIKMNIEYVQSSFSSVYNFLFGTPLKEVPTILKYGLNPHNSFIRAHVYFGFLGFLLLMVMLGYTSFLFFKTKNYIFGLFLVALSIRAFLDSNAFHGSFDALFYFLIFYAIKDIKFSYAIRTDKNIAIN